MSPAGFYVRLPNGQGYTWVEYSEQRVEQGRRTQTLTITEIKWDQWADTISTQAES